MQIKCSAEAIKMIGQTLSEIERIDQDLDWLAGKFDSMQDFWANKVRQTFGGTPHKLAALNDSVLGHIASAAVINTLLDERARLAATVPAFVAVEKVPCDEIEPLLVASIELET